MTATRNGRCTLLEFPKITDLRLVIMGNVFKASGGFLVQFLCPSRGTQSRLPRTMTRQLLKICKEGDYTTSPGSLCQGSITCTVKTCFPIMWRNLPCSSLCPFLLVLALDTTEKRLVLSSLHFCSGIYRHWESLLSLLCGLNSPSSQPLLKGKCTSPLMILVALCWTHCIMYRSLLYWVGTVLQVRPHWCWVEWKDHLSSLDGDTGNPARIFCKVFLASGSLKSIEDPQEAVRENIKKINKKLIAVISLVIEDDFFL